MVFLLLAAASAMGQVIPAARCFTNGWRHAGRIGAIPEPDRIINVRDYGAAGDGTHNDAPAIMSAIAALGSAGGVVYFPAGTYAVPNDTVYLSSNVVLRGERSFNTTILATNLLKTQTAVISIFGNNANDPGTPWQDMQSGYDLLSSTVTLTNVSSFSAGDWVETHEGTNSAWNMSAWYDMVGQILQVSNVTVTVPPAGRLTFTTPLRLQYQPGLAPYGIPINPQIRKFDKVIMNVGVENLRIARVIAGTSTMRDNVPSISFKYAVNCWVRGCEFTNVFGSACSGDYSANTEITGNYVHHAYEFDGGGSGYGVVFQYQCSEFRVENNIFQVVRHAVVLQAGVNGNVIGYNYSTGSGASLSDFTAHGNYAYANLYEGNCGYFLSLDNSHGANGPWNVFFRNRARGVVGQAMAITDTIGSNETFVGNEGVGSYSIAKPGLFEYGNNDDGTIKPAGTDSLPDYSYYLGGSVTSAPPTPAWWNIAQTIPPYGPTNGAPVPPIGTERDIPARTRFFAAGPKTYGPPSLYLQPTNQAVSLGQPASFLVGATGTPVAVFQWYKNGSPLPGETNALLSLPAVGLTDAGLYRAVITDSGGQVTSAGATLTLPGVYFPVVATAAAHGGIDPTGAVSLACGTVSNFLITAQPYYHIAEILTDGGSVAGAAGLTNYTLAWGPAYASGTVAVSFAENQTTNGTPEWWLAGYGLTSPDFETAAAQDTDGDGSPNWMEYVVGTVPTNRDSALRIVSALDGSGGGGCDFELRWRSASNRSYAVWWTTNLAQPFEPLCSDLAASPPTNTYVHSNVAPPNAYYRIRVSIPEN